MYRTAMTYVSSGEYGLFWQELMIPSTCAKLYHGNNYIPHSGAADDLGILRYLCPY